VLAHGPRQTVLQVKPTLIANQTIEPVTLAGDSDVKIDAAKLNQSCVHPNETLSANIFRWFPWPVQG